MRRQAPTFDDFWRAYPLRRGRRDAERAWNRLSATDKRKALDGIARYRACCQQTGIAFKYPQGWISGRRWEDEYDDLPSAAASPAPPSVDQFSDMEKW